MLSSWAVCVALWTLSIQSVRAAAPDNTSSTWVPLENVKNICGRDDSYSSGVYTFSTNRLEPQGAVGWQCMEVGDAPHRFNNESAWAVSWMWEDDSATTLHGFPNARINHTVLPTRISGINTLWLYAIWTYVAGNGTAKAIDGVINVDMAANVVLDIFIDSDPQKAGSPTEAKHELMVWLGAYGGVLPIGYKSTPVKKRTVGKVNFNLYEGTNERGQHVYSWMADTNTTTFFSDISALVQSLAKDSGDGFSDDDYIGLVRLGTQTYHTKSNSSVTFTAQVMKLEVIPGIPKPLDSGVGSLRVGFGSILLPVGVGLAAIFFG